MHVGYLIHVPAVVHMVCDQVHLGIPPFVFASAGVNGPCNREVLSQGMGVLNICILRLLMGGSHRARWCVCRTKCGVHGQEKMKKKRRYMKAEGVILVM